jgi:outer membrane protein with beta-barrel domain
MPRLVRLILIAVSACTLASPLNAQAPAKEFNFGLTAGVNFTTFGGSDAGNPDYRTGIMAGAFVAYPAWSAVSVKAEGFYTQKGAKDASGGGSGTFKVDYLEFPLLLDLHPPHQHGKFSPHAFGGFYGAFVVSCQIEASQGGQSAQADCDSLGQGIRGTDFGFVLGLGLNLGRLSIDGRYDIGESKVDNSGANLDVKNQVFAISASYHLGSYK